jgi:hypothetical protein
VESLIWCKHQALSLSQVWCTQWIHSSSKWIRLSTWETRWRNNKYRDKIVSSSWFIHQGRIIHHRDRRAVKVIRAQWVKRRRVAVILITSTIISIELVTHWHIHNQWHSYSNNILRIITLSSSSCSRHSNSWTCYSKIIIVDKMCRHWHRSRWKCNLLIHYNIEYL